VDTADIAGHVQGFSALAAGCVINSIRYGVNHQDACAELAPGVEVWQKHTPEDSIGCW
jgi:hypothetical protein